MKNDLSESTNLSETHLEKAKPLQGMLAAWRKDVDANMPRPNPKYQGK
ncbi:MAG: hypothetical protein N2C14_05765 [Planctomycetales bacterium]